MGARLNAACHMPAIRTSGVNSPVPIRNRSSSLRGMLAPTPRSFNAASRSDLCGD